MEILCKSIQHNTDIKKTKGQTYKEFPFFKIQNLKINNKSKASTRVRNPKKAWKNKFE
jgi:hypothetical protein